LAPLNPQRHVVPWGTWRGSSLQVSVNLFEQAKSTRECEEAFVEFEKYGAWSVQAPER